MSSFTSLFSIEGLVSVVFDRGWKRDAVLLSPSFSTYKKFKIAPRLFCVGIKQELQFLHGKGLCVVLFSTKVDKFIICSYRGEIALSFLNEKSLFVAL